MPKKIVVSRANTQMAIVFDVTKVNKEHLQITFIEFIE